VITLDDFGTGYSSLAFLKRYPIDKIKIDRTFVRDIPSANDDMVICRAIVDLGWSLGLQVIAEGVENDAHRRFLQSIDCHHMQGYLFAKPMPADEAYMWTMPS
jgi:diguanylate cyclase